jgi:uncharacterized membrane-anchored protein
MFERLLPLSHRTRQIVLGVTSLIILLLVNSQILVKERIIRDGDHLLLPLAPRDPRSLLQGDYMALRYAMAREVAEAADAAGIGDGRIVVDLAASGEASFNALFTGQPLAPNQRLLRFRKRGGTVRLASDAFFFQEGEGDIYVGARYGELRIDAQGNGVLIGLRDRDLNPLGTGLRSDFPE